MYSYLSFYHIHFPSWMGVLALHHWGLTFSLLLLLFVIIIINNKHSVTYVAGSSLKMHQITLTE